MSATLRIATVPALEALPGCAHGFEQRLGPAGWESRESGQRRVAGALASAGRLLLLRQVHGAGVRAAPWDATPEGDAAVAEAPGFLLGIETADCLPILLADPGRRAVAAVHAGWRGTAAAVARAGVAALVEGGSKPADLVAALGPAIGPCCYEVGDEVREALGPGGDGCFRPGPRGRPHLDLRAANERQLREAGVVRIHHVPDCTFCHADLYHSFRREGKDAGRMISFIGWREEA
ncbi:MAG: peptidoglycan editing factor PgeF [Acidobacteria bacterium]|nr:peptidoglycan editing factor PgeF [Acidobacteriota bacterium]